MMIKQAKVGHLLTATLLFYLLVPSCQSLQEETSYDVIVYGGTPAGIMAAVEASKHGSKVLLIEQTQHLGGMCSSGLMTAETEHMLDTTITGLAKNFLVELGNTYYDSAYFQTFHHGPEKQFKKGKPAFYFESNHFEEQCNRWVRDHNIEVLWEQRIKEVQLDNGLIQQIVLTNGKTYQGKFFIDASYEGDLMALSGVSYALGREAKSVYNEKLAGIRLIDDTLSARTKDSNGKLLSYFSQAKKLEPGSGDGRVMNFNFRPTLTKNKANQVPLYPPENYDPKEFDFLADYLEANPELKLGQLIGVYSRGNQKYEFNNQQRSLISLGMFGANTEYTEGDRETREAVYQKHKKWTLGYLWFLANDPRVPDALQAEMNLWGFVKDQFADNQNFPYYLYIREGRRMKGDYIHTEKDIFKDREKEDAIFLGSHWIDCHHVQRIALSDSTFTNEGRIWEMVDRPYELPYRALIPKASECKNLIVPVAASFSHVAFCSYRLESTWMQAGHVAGLAASQCIESTSFVQDLDIQTLQSTLVQEGMMLDNAELGNWQDPERTTESLKYKGLNGRMYEYYESL